MNLTFRVSSPQLSGGSKVALLAFSLLSFAGMHPASAQVDANTTLYLPFNNSLNGAQGETPAASSGVTFATGFSSLSGSAAVLGNSSLLSYAASGNINATVGTLEFFIKPDWNGNDLQTHTILTWGGAGGVVFSKDGANNLRSIFNRFSVGGQGEAGVAFNVSSWQANQWHGVSYTWNNSTKSVKLYIDGVLAASDTFTINLPSVADTNFFVGSDNGTGNYLNGALDELRISNVERSASEVNARYASFVPAASAPEPSTPLLMLSGLLTMSVLARRRRQSGQVLLK